jgi:hypothetical protein
MKGSKVHPHVAIQNHANKATQAALVAALTKETESEKSSILDPEEAPETIEEDANDIIARTIAEGGLATKKNSLAFVRSQLKKKIVREVLAEVLPDIGALCLRRCRSKLCCCCVRCLRYQRHRREYYQLEEGTISSNP